MSNSKIKKVVISRENLPSLGFVNGKYNIRYRLISEDRNRISHWSPIYEIPLLNTVDLTKTKGTTTVTKDSVNKITSIRSIWTPPADLKTNTFDVYYRLSKSSQTLSDTPYIYAHGISSTSYDLVVSTDETADGYAGQFQIIIQISTDDKTIQPAAKIYDSGQQNLV